MRIIQKVYRMTKKVLLLSHIPPFPVIGGDRVRVAQGLGYLAQNYKTDIAYITHDPKVVQMKAYLPEINEEYRFYIPRLRRYMQAFRTLYNGKAEIVNHYDNKCFRDFVNAHIHEYDFVLCGSVAMAGYILGRKDVRAYMDMTDSLSMNRFNAAMVARGIWKYLYRMESKRLAEYEKKCLREFRRVAYISQIDADFIAGGDKMIIGNTVAEVAASDCCRHNTDSFDIVFIGKMDYSPNILAAEFFASQVMPRIETDCSFYIVGVNPTSAVLGLGEMPDIRVTGFVESIAPYMQRAAIVVAPMLSGSGVQNKILEAMAHGCCVVTTPKGLEGIEHLRDALVVCEPDAKVMAKAVTSLLKNSELRAEKGRRARCSVCENFGRERINAQYRDFFSE